MIDIELTSRAISGPGQMAHSRHDEIMRQMFIRESRRQISRVLSRGQEPESIDMS